MSDLCPICPYLRSAFTLETGLGWSAYHGNSIEVLKSLPEGSVDALISDPPYGTGANTLMGRLKPSSEKYRSTGAAPLPDIDGDSLMPEAWQDMMGQILRRSYRVLKPGATVLLFCDWRSLPSLINVVSYSGFALQAVPVWDKGRGSRPRKNGFRSQSELILWAKKPGVLDGPEPPVYLDGVLKHSTLSNHKQHLTQKPLPLMKELVRVVPKKGLVLDPFQGSGTTGVAALEQGLTYIGIESVPEYHKIACERLAASQARAA
ncbi:site-specific DNA-methyltransferase [bacterium (Candidatus Blackallbacteria) CG17_big_fil_post_rev_8_21_14_2_50_48_46]|uniref:Methyltransferase n=1 Tax=bacterium (Candidatus Blackallbacteria) CG17_big_fil_post_rev_8_21_14_2_50_48_46 TaxID=2014261 RepID=A0A2M7G5P9_9BACT|nr:MAG: site-specific DNA-methyltransferase [bacterium (Candidatus Blackallbacteria) CG18_big_fil_WC_8_21_14_2_50_49_26]PIW17321.1 MAG: site-specific DNA-methyltransferase [bacterium (Candidatus Blackallbacteria) CG17_big_fil_post_rev_8_21_14_2_50_48_46]PIW47447.1 MAG: site-specific DNA-methyltransferase [bacterium (Candidatus Blackallbacteria) CG13_big_fil_rev_8_21_14_2_50_49_14]